MHLGRCDWMRTASLVYLNTVSGRMVTGLGTVVAPGNDKQEAGDQGQEGAFFPLLIVHGLDLFFSTPCACFAFLKTLTTL